ncbi:MAG TPA: YezD family protein [Haliangiales bacterium]|nr:YezD family protein [Haliangiales bacterium]
MNLLTNAKDSSPPTWLHLVKEQISSLRFGVVQIVVHDSRVVQIERTEKLRLDRTDDKPTATS